MDQRAVPNPLRIAVAERNVRMRRALRALLEAEGGFELEGQAHDLAGVRRVLRLQQPNVMLLDLALLAPHGLLLLPQLARERPQTAIVATGLSQWAGQEEVLLRLGAKGFIAKTAPPESWLVAIRESARQAPRLDNGH
ncbi:MAG TPA: response regulator [Solirubrobacterales bacterium]